MREETVPFEIHSDLHDYCPLTGFCRNCGIHQEMAEHDLIDCHHGNNVVAISHVRAWKIAQEKAEIEKAQKLTLINKDLTEGAPLIHSTSTDFTDDQVQRMVDHVNSDPDSA